MAPRVVGFDEADQITPIKHTQQSERKIKFQPLLIQTLRLIFLLIDSRLLPALSTLAAQGSYMSFPWSRPAGPASRGPLPYTTMTRKQTLWAFLTIQIHM